MQSVTTKRWDWVSASILVSVLLVTAYRLTTTNWIPGLIYVFNTALLGSILGLALGYSKFERKGVIFLTAAYTAILIPWQLTITLRTESIILQRLGNLGGRLLFAVIQIAERKPVQDPLFFLAFMTITFWVLALHSTFFFVRRRNNLVSVLPAVFGIIVIQYYDSYYGERIWTLAIFFFLCLMLLARTYLVERNEEWRQQRVFMSPETGFDFTNGALVTASIIILAVWIVPGLGSPIDLARNVWKHITTPLNDIQDRLEDALASVRGSGTTVPAQFGSVLNLGRSVSISDEVLFTVQAADLSVPRYYWRGRIYDSYVGGKWINAQENRRSFSPTSNEELLIPNDETRSPGRFIFNLQDNRTTMVAPSEPRWFSRDAQLIYASTDGESIDLLMSNPLTVLHGGESYEVRSGVRSPTISDLRAAGTEYPEWVVERYLQLPQDISPIIMELAQTITEDWDAPYDKAYFITNYLRSNITYADTIEAPPPGVDIMEWFLFDSKIGFCNYYATAEVLMLRSVGIPARIVVGYAEGEELRRNVFAVRVRDYHAWPEVYFPEIGWVEFEPTTSQPVLGRPLGDVSSNPGAGPNPGELPLSDLNLGDEDFSSRIDRTEEGLTPTEELQPDSQALLGQLLAWFIAMACGIAAGLYFRRLSQERPLMVRIPMTIRYAYERSNMITPKWVEDWLQWSELTPIERAFQSINRALRLLGNPQPIYATPSERVSTLLNLMPESEPEINALAAEHEASLFTPNPGDEKRAWQLQWRIYLKAINRKFNPPVERY